MQQPSRARLGDHLFSRRGVLALLALVLAGLGLLDWWYERRKEKRYDGAIMTVAQRYGAPPGLVKAVVWRESRFNPRVRGRVGEIGLMQIRALTAQEWAQAVQRRSSFDGDLFRPETNLDVGAWYVAKLLRRYAKTDNPAAYALADYNAGRNNVLRWNKGAAETNSSSFIKQITFPATQEYIRTILRSASKYQPGFERK